VDPVTWEHNCMEEVCGACAMLINGRPRPACSTLVDSLLETDPKAPIVLEPLPKFPVVRDLLVDRSRIEAGLRQVRAWVHIDGAWDIHAGAPRISPREWSANYLYSRCMACGCCMAACPQFHPGSAFVGPAPLAQVRLMNAHPTGRYDKVERLHAIMGDGGLSDCGNAQNCVRVCPKDIPLTTAIGELGRQVTVQMLKDLFGAGG
jgi:succinate dehydrogenase / fumarate reductase iron-sulfur subunit